MNKTSNSSTSFVQSMLLSASNVKEKEKRHSDKFKVLKAENKKLINLLKETEMLFY